jgi:two-component system chemotaxis response regulator CheB
VATAEAERHRTARWALALTERETVQNRDIIVIGASMGGIEAVKQVAANLPAGLPAAVFVVIHSGAGAPGVLPQMLDKAGPLRCFRASDGEPFERGRIYAAPPDRHLLLEPNCVLTRHGPRENGFRPAIDPLFRSAAVHFGGRVIGVVLTGFLNDGTAGLRAIKRCGGLAVVQDPADAIAPEMPRSALRHVAVDHCVPLDALGALLARLAAEPAGESPEVPEFVRREARSRNRSKGACTSRTSWGRPQSSPARIATARFGRSRMAT